MKTLIIFLFSILFINTLSCQVLPIDTLTGLAIYSQIKSIDSITKHELYFKALEWVTYRFNSSNDVIKFKNEEIGKIVGKGSYEVKNFAYSEHNTYINFTITTLFKDNRYKIIISDLIFKDDQGHNFPIEQMPHSWGWKKKLYGEINSEMESLMNDFYLFESKKSIEETNW